MDGFFQADEIKIHSFGEKLLVFGVKRKDGEVSEIPFREESALELKSALKSAEKELGPIVDLDIDGYTSYPLSTRWLGAIHRPVNRSKESFRKQGRSTLQRRRKPVEPRLRLTVKPASKDHLTFSKGVPIQLAFSDLSVGIFSLPFSIFSRTSLKLSTISSSASSGLFLPLSLFTSFCFRN